MAGRELSKRGRSHELTPHGSGSPWGMLNQLRREMDRLFEGFPGMGFGTSEMGELASIPIDIEETDDHVKLQAELPGVTENDIELSLEPGGEVLVIKGEKKTEREESDRGVYRSERAYGRFERTVALPAAVKEDQIEARFRNGVLTVEMAKAEEGRGRTRIPIKPS